MNWQTVYVFISSTFNDMHAERDLLVKQVFPALRMWCAKRKLKLVDVDLRWGVSAADAQENKRVVEVCMKNIDKCRPFFLCFLGQRRGWVPEESDINAETLKLFPELSRYIGNTSVTELEILHALMHPLSDGASPVEHARFYFRDKSYLKQIATPEHKALFCPKKGLFSRGDSTFERFKTEIRNQYPVVDYSATWNADKPSPELTDTLSMGRLDNFRVGNTTLAQDVLHWLQEEITQQFPKNREVMAVTSPLAIELDRQDIQLFQALDGYIPRPLEEEALFTLISENDNTPILLLADAGCGKTSLLAQMIDKMKEKTRLYYRFVGTTPSSFRKSDLASSLINEWIRDGLLPEEDGAHAPEELALLFANLLVKAGSRQPFTLILDGMDQLSDNLDEHFLPQTLPSGCHLIFSLRSDVKWIPSSSVRTHHLGLMSDREDKIRMIKEYLNTFLKDIDDEQLEKLLSMEGSGNPLYMKIVLNELRQHGSFDTLFEMFNKNYGTTPFEAFNQVILRIKNQLIAQGYSEYLAQIIFGCLACTHEGLDGDMFHKAIKHLTNANVDHLSKQEICDIVYGLAQELEPFFVFDGNKLFLRYDSMRRAFYELFPSYDIIIHSMLAIAFAERAIEDTLPTYMEAAMHHICYAWKDFCFLFFQSPQIPLWCIEHNGSKLLADTFQTLGYTRGFTEFIHPSEVISKACIRLDTLPETLFLELKRYGDISNTIIQNLLKAEKDFTTNNYLIPITQPDNLSILQNEYALPESTLYSLVHNESYYILYTKDIIQLIDRRTQKLANVLYLDPPKDFYDSIKIAAQDDILYVCKLNRSELQSWKCYSLPKLNLISEGVASVSQKIRVHELHILDGLLYAFYAEHLWDLSNHDFYSAKPENLTLACINNSEVLYSASTKDTAECNFLGDYLLYRDAGPGTWFIIRTKDGKVLVKDQFLGYETVVRNDIYAGGANLRAGLGKTLAVWLSGVDVIDGKNVLTYDIRNYRILENGELELFATSGKLDVSISCLNVLPTGHILVESQGALCVLDESFHILGYMDLNDPLQGSASWSGKFCLIDDDALLAFYQGKIQQYSFKNLLASLQADPIKTGNTKLDAAVRNGWLYVFGQKMSRTNFVTCEHETAPGESGIIERICPWNVNDHFCCTSTAYNGLNYTQHDLDMITEPNSCKLETLEGYILLHAFHYIDKEDELKPCFVTIAPNAQRHTYKGEEKVFVPCYFLTPHFLQSKDEPYFWNVENLSIELLYDKIHNFRVETICCNSDAYVVLPNVYKNENELSVCVIQASTRKVIFEQTIPSSITPLGLDKIYCYNKGLILSYKEDGKYIWYHLDLEQNRLIRDTDNRRPIECPIRDDYVYLRRGNTMTIDIYSLLERRIVKSFTLTERNGFFVRQILRVKNYLLVVNFNSDILEIYDYESGEKLFDQRMEQIVENLYLDPESQHIAMLDTSQRVHIWKIKD